VVWLDTPEEENKKQGSSFQVSARQLKTALAIGR
jgi:hypothetical protein